MRYTVNIKDIEGTLLILGGEAKTKDIQDTILEAHCNGVVPDNYLNERSFRMTIQRKIEDYCPQAVGYDPTKKEGKFLRVGHGLYRIASGHKHKEFPALEEVPKSNRYIEGTTKKVLVNNYERNSEARKKCIDHFGSKCFVCNFDFEEVYGELGKGFIHIHHIIPLSEIQTSYQVNPITDLIPLCANCHAMIHRPEKALAVKILKEKLIKDS